VAATASPGRKGYGSQKPLNSLHPKFSFVKKKKKKKKKNSVAFKRKVVVTPGF
jgi:hypothetical protein